MYQMPLQLDNTYGVSRETLNLVKRYSSRAFTRDELLMVWFEDEHAEFETVCGKRTSVRYEDMQP
jgi:hypothetical protein